MKRIIITLLVAVFSFTLPVFANNYIDTQFASDGVEVHIRKITEQNNVMTIIFEIENTSDSEVKFNSMPIKEVYYNTSDKKYPVLQDSEGKYLATTITYKPGRDFVFYADGNWTGNNLEMSGGAKKIGWAKFQAPQAEEWPIEFSMPGVTPFLLEKPE